MSIQKLLEQIENKEVLTLNEYCFLLGSNQLENAKKEEILRICNQ